MIFNETESANINRVKTHIKGAIECFDILRKDVLPLPWHTDIVFSGGYFASSLNGDSYNDIDVFVLNKRIDIYELLCHKHNLSSSVAGTWTYKDENAVKYLRNPHVREVATNKVTNVQIILTDHKTRQELLADFDYKHCTVSYSPAHDKLYITREAYDCIMKKELVINKSNTVPAPWRREKFLKKGWSYGMICPSSFGAIGSTYIHRVNNPKGAVGAAYPLDIKYG